MKPTEEQLSAMYGQDDDDEIEVKRPQPPQLRFAGKATLIPHEGDHLPVPRIEYVETLEKTVRDQNKLIMELTKRMRKLELQSSRAANIAERRLSTLEKEVDKLKNNRWG